LQSAGRLSKLSGIAIALGWLKALFYSTGRPVRLGRTQYASDLASDLGSEGPFSLQTVPSDMRNWITLEPINSAEPVFPETATVFLLIRSEESQ